MDAEQRVAAQHFNIPVLEVEGIVRGYGRGLVVRGVCSGEVGQAGDAE